MSNPKHEAKQKLNGALARYRRALNGNPNEDSIRETVQGAIASGVDGVQAFELGVRMCKEHSGRVTLESEDGPIIFEWGWFAKDESR
jgi:hypothetical protein